MSLEMYRWVVVLSGLVVQVSLGTMYIWSMFKNPLMQQFNWDPVAVSLTFSLVIITFFSTTIFAGRIQDKVGPRWVATVGGILYGLGLFLASKTTSLPYFYITYGVIGGIGIGCGYVCPLATCMKWFPDKRGLITGIIVAGFGLGAMVFSNFAKELIATRGILDSFAVLGGIYAALIIVASQFLKNPPLGYKPAGWNPPVVQGKAHTTVDFNWNEMLKTSQFWLIVFSYFFGANAGLMTVSNTVSIATAQGVTAAMAIVAVQTISFCNSGGRILNGMFSDKIGRIKVLKGLFFVTAATMFIFPTLSGFPVLIAIAVTGFCWGGFLAIYPSMTADFFGVKNWGVNYGFVFMVSGLGSMTSPFMYDLLKGFGLSAPMLWSGALGAIGFVMMFFLNPPVPPAITIEGQDTKAI